MAGQDATEQTMCVEGLQRVNGVYLYLVQGCEQWIAESELHLPTESKRWEPRINDDDDLAQPAPS